MERGRSLGFYRLWRDLVWTWVCEFWVSLWQLHTCGAKWKTGEQAERCRWTNFKSGIKLLLTWNPFDVYVKTPLANVSAGGMGLISAKGKILWRREWQHTLVFLSGKSLGQGSLAGCSSWCHKESDTTDKLNLTTNIYISFSKCIHFFLGCRK